MNIARKARSSSLNSTSILIIMFCSMVTASMCLNKVSPVMAQIKDSLNIVSETQAGLLISIFVISGMFLALPIGVIIEKTGIYKTGLIALSASLLGSLIGIIPAGYPLMLISRVVEGIGLMLLATIGPTVVAKTVSPKNYRMANGLIMGFMAFGQLIMFNAAPRITEHGSWRNIWWLTAAWALVMLIIWFFTFRSFDIDKLQRNKPGNTNILSSSVMKNGHVWLLGITLALYMIGKQGIITFLVHFLMEERGMDNTLTGFIVSLSCLIGLPIGILTGFVADRVGSCKKPIIVLSLFSAIVYCIMPSFPTGIYPIIVILYGIASMGIAGLIFSSIKDVIDKPEDMNMAVSIVNIFQWVGLFLSSVLFGFMLDLTGWNITFYVMGVLSVLAAVTALLNTRAK